MKDIVSYLEYMNAYDFMKRCNINEGALMEG